MQEFYYNFQCTEMLLTWANWNCPGIIDAIVALKLLFCFIILQFLKALNIKLILNAKIWNQEQSYNIDSFYITIFWVLEFQIKTELAKYALLTDM